MNCGGGGQINIHAYVFKAHMYAQPAAFCQRYQVLSRCCCLRSELAPSRWGSDGQDFGTAACQPPMSRDAVGQRGWGWTGLVADSEPGELALDRRVTFCYGK